MLLAKLFAKPANVIVLDEPTNDLDAETLELLEDRLVQFQGTVLVVSHDRAFLEQRGHQHDRVRAGGVKEYVGGYDDWLRQRQQAEEAKQQGKADDSIDEKRAAALPEAASETKRRLSYKEQQELRTLPATIEGLEAEVAALHTEMAQPEFYKQSGELIAQQQARLNDLEAELAAAYSRWQELEQVGQ